MIFDVLALDGEDLRRQPLARRREVLEELAEGWTPPLQLSPR
jgi:ATP-dependent DNA ligase